MKIRSIAPIRAPCETGPGGTGRAVASRRSWNGPVGRPQWSARCRRDRMASYFSWRHAVRITWHHTLRPRAPGLLRCDHVWRPDALHRPGGETTPADDTRTRQQMRQWSRRWIYARRRYTYDTHTRRSTWTGLGGNATPARKSRD